MKHFISPLTMSALILSILGVVFFYGALQFATESRGDFMVLLILLLVVIGISSVVSAHFWEKALIKRHKKSHISISSSVIVGGDVFGPLSNVQIDDKPLLLLLYIFIGDFLRDSFGINIYYLDYHGFALLYLGISGILLALAFDFILLKNLIKDKKSN